MSGVEAPARVVVGTLPLLPRSPLTLGDVRSRAVELGAVGGVWVVTCHYQCWRRYAELVGVFGDLGDALAEVEGEVELEWQTHPQADVAVSEVPERMWEITLGTVVVRLEWAPVIRPGQGAVR